MLVSRTPGLVDGVKGDAVGGRCGDVQRNYARNFTEFHEDLPLDTLSRRHDKYSESPIRDSKLAQVIRSDSKRIIFQRLKESRSEIDSAFSAG
jgi:hypothetical protein